MPSLRDTIVAIHDAPHRAVLAVTGGGSGAISELLAVSGASRTVLEAVVPYDDDALADFLGGPPDRYCHADTALAMAVVAFRRARTLAAGEDGPLVGVGCTAALATDRPRRGTHRCFVATQTDNTTRLASLVLEKGARERAAEETVVTALVLAGLGETCELTGLPGLPLGEHDVIERQAATADAPLAAVWNGHADVAWSLPGGRLTDSSPAEPAGLLPGSFHPLHDGHRDLRAAAEEILGGAVCYELSVFNVDKPPLDFLSIETRREQFTGSILALTTAATFVEKARRFPGATFVVGADTAVRVLDDRFYLDQDDRERALAEIGELGCRFLVAGRVSDDSFLTLSEIETDGFGSLFEELPADRFRVDLSSTALRDAGEFHDRDTRE